jgi:radical SAM superfamily enzyme YgiQ (UPF0313 family)
MPSSKDILLINPWIYDFTAYDYWLEPLGLLYIASILKKHTNYRLSFIDCLDRHHPLLKKKLKAKPDGRGSFQKEEVSKPSVLKKVPRKYSRYGIPISLFVHELNQRPKPELVLLTCTMTYWYPGVQLVSELVRQKFGRVPVVLGGIYATLMPEHARSHSGADIVIEGAAENKILPLVSEVLGNGHSPQIEFETLEDIPWPAFDLLRNKESLPLLTSRGCPFRCSFCASPLLHKNFEQRSPFSVISEIEDLYRRYETRNFAFYDDALLLNKEHHIFPILKELIQRKMPLTFHAPNGLHVREIDPELASLFKSAGVQSLFLSQESFDEKLLARACPKVRAGDLEKALLHLEQAGYSRQEINVYLIVGLPGQDVSAIKESILRVRRLGARPRLAYFSPVPGTEEWRNLIEKGYLPQDADPLLHNKLTFPYLWGSFSSSDFESVRSFLNSPD